MNADDCFDHEFINAHVLLKSQGKRAQHYPKGWLTAWPELLLYLFNDLTKREVLVFMSIAAQTKYLNRTSVTRKSLSTNLGIQKNHIDTIVKKLIKRNAVHEQADKTLQIDPRYGWFGNVDQYHEACDALDKKTRNSALR